MSYVFEIDGETVRSPALQVGAVFHRYTQALEAVLGVPAGVTEFASDYLLLDRSQLRVFAHELQRFGGSGHVIAQELSRPVLAVCLVMLHRAGAPTAPSDGDPAEDDLPYPAGPRDLAAYAHRMPT